MLDRVKSGLNLTIIFVFIVAFIYFLVMTIINSFSSANIKENTGLNQNSVEIYVSEDKLVTNYTTFFNVEKIVQSTIVSLNQGKYQQIYSIFSYQLQKNMSKEYFLSHVDKYLSDNFKYDLEDENDRVGYVNRSNLKMLYQVNDDEFIAVVTSLNNAKQTKIGIKLLNDREYVITYLEI